MQYPCTLHCVLSATLLLAQPAVAEIYRAVDAQGMVTYSDQPSAGAELVPEADYLDASTDPTGTTSLTDAQRVAQQRIEAELALAERLAADRRQRSEERLNRALSRAEVRESQAREQALAAEQQQAQARTQYPAYYWPDYAPYVPHRHRPAPLRSPYRPMDPHDDDRHADPSREPDAPEPRLRSPLPQD